MKIEILKEEAINSDFKNQISELFKQLSPDKKQIGLSEILDNKNPITFAYCIENDTIIGVAAMCTYKVISGSKGWIEDVIVDENSRGRSVGQKLIEKLLETAKEKNLSEVLLFTEDRSGIPFILKSLCPLFCIIPVMYLYNISFHSALIIPFLYLTAKTK